MCERIICLISDFIVWADGFIAAKVQNISELKTTDAKNFSEYIALNIKYPLVDITAEFREPTPDFHVKSGSMLPILLTKSGANEDIIRLTCK